MSFTLDIANWFLDSHEETSKKLLERKAYGLLMHNYEKCIESYLFIA